jgi:hypothetical protein
VHDDWRILLSPDARVFTVILPLNRALNFVFDGTFWIWDEDSQFLRPAQMEQSLDVISAAEPTDHADNWPLAATISHSGAVHEFLMLRIRLGHLNYTTMLRALQAGTWTGFHHSFAHIHLEQLPRCPVCASGWMKNKHLLISDIVDIVDDNSDEPWIYCLRKKSDAFAMALKVFVNTVYRPRGIHYFALRIDNAGAQAYYRQEFNGVAEKFLDTLLCMIRCMLESTHMPSFLWSHAARHACRLIGACPKAPDWTIPDWKWDLPDVSGFRTFGCRVYTHMNREIGTLDAGGEEMRYLGCSHDSHFHHLYRAHDRRVFTTDDVTFVETDIQLPDYSGNMEIELAGLQRLTEEEQRLVDAHAERDDEVD